MILTLHDDRLTSLERLEQLLAGTAGFAPQVAAATEAERQAHVLAVLRRFRYVTLKRAQKGLVLRYLLHTSGYSRQHLTRLIARFRARVPLGQRKPPTRGFNRRYTEDDIVSLAKLDAVHENLSGPATRHLCQRAWDVHHDARYGVVSVFVQFVSTKRGKCRRINSVAHRRVASESRPQSY